MIPSRGPFMVSRKMAMKDEPNIGSRCSQNVHFLCLFSRRKMRGPIWRSTVSPDRTTVSPDRTSCFTDRTFSKTQRSYSNETPSMFSVFGPRSVAPSVDGRFDLIISHVKSRSTGATLYVRCKICSSLVHSSTSWAPSSGTRM